MQGKLIDQIHDAASDGDADELTRLLAAHPEMVDVENEDGEAPLVSAAVEGHDNTIRVLLEAGADVCRQKGFALTCACYWGHRVAVQELLAGGGEQVVREVRRWHGLHAACGWGRHPDIEIVRMLLEAGATATRVFEGKTPIQYAKSAGREDIVELLRESTRK